MKETKEKVYRCDFCNKAMVSKGFMVLHERMCKKNPKNQHQCFKYCENLIKEQYEVTDEYGCKIGESEISFTCKKRPDIQLYSYKLERYKSKKERLKNMERMPLECELYKTEEGHNFSQGIDELSTKFPF